MSRSEVAPSGRTASSTIATNGIAITTAIAPISRCLPAQRAHLGSVGLTATAGAVTSRVSRIVACISRPSRT